MSQPAARLQIDLPLAEMMHQSAPEWLVQARRQALESMDLSLPTRQHEHWRYNRMRPLTDIQWGLPQTPTQSSFEQVEAMLPATDCRARVVFIDGYFVPECSSLEHLDQSVEFSTLSKPNDLLKTTYTRRHPNVYFDGLNLAMAQDGVLLRLGPNADFGLQLVTVDTGQNHAAFLRHAIVVESNASLRLEDVQISLVSGPALTLNHLNLELAQSARCVHRRHQMGSRESVNLFAAQLQQGQDSVFDTHQVATGGGLSRDEYHIALSGQGSACRCAGVSLPEGGQQLDTHLFLDHLAEQTRSEQAYRSVVCGASQGIFHGGVHVAQTGGGAVAHQSSRNLLLTPNARMQTKPELVIETEDVECSHGATVGFLDQGAEFYLRTRGLNHEQARALLATAFVSEVIDPLEDGPWKDHIATCVSEKLSRMVANDEQSL